FYSCQRFSGIRQFCLGNIWDDPTEEDILKSPAFLMLEEKAEKMKTVCGDCQHFPYCNGGCLYSAFTADSDKDPNCAAYKTVFDEMLVDMGHEILEVLNHRESPTPVLCMSGDQPHPYDRREKLRQIRKALEQGISSESKTPPPFFPENQLNKVFFNLTRKCPLRCTHCWAGNQKSEGVELPPERYAELTAQAADLRFRHIIFTGGEPFVYKGFEYLTDLLDGIDRKGAELVLRTSFAFRISDDMLLRIAKVFDRVIVSVDGDRDEHDARRGAGSYEKTVSNLERFSEIADARKLGLWTVLDKGGQSDKVQTAVRTLGSRLNVGFVHFDGMKPLGNACFQECDLTSDLPARAEELRIRRNCGLGHILHVEPDGKAYACYVCIGGPDAVLANLSADPLNSVCGRLFGYARSGVDTNEKCSACPVRYLCGGLCLAYRPHPEDPDNGDFDCGSRLHKIKELTADLEGQNT
ncbi:MAG: radical SAM protein, partial [Anaerolineaceae bacterium]|nr:radical SAM protein [Anaerolineaceae bacterium]